MRMRTVKVGIIGLGHNGLAHARCHRQSPKSELVALCDTNGERLHQAAEELGVRRLYTGDDVFDDPDIEAISINTGDNHHADSRSGRPRKARNPGARAVTIRAYGMPPPPSLLAPSPPLKIRHRLCTVHVWQPRRYP